MVAPASSQTIRGTTDGVQPFFFCILAQLSRRATVRLNTGASALLSGIERLLEVVLTAPERQHFLLIGAYRDNEVDSVHPLSIALEQLRKEHHLTIRAEARVGDRGCIVESSTGQVDARIKSRLRQLRHLLSEKMGTRNSS